MVGTVSDWIRLPQPYSYYTNGESGTQWKSYPNNAPRMAEDAVKAALEKSVQFDASLDTFQKGIITALFIVHSGRGAEKQARQLQGQHIWSHKWNLRNPVQVSNDLWATIYLTVPQDCKLGVCAHELGHLAFQWQDFYDPNYSEDGTSWDGTGDWDLMASGSYNGGELKPAHPAALHKIQHGWVPVTTVTKTKGLRIRPYTATTGRVYKLVSPAFKAKQYLLLESRIRAGFDSHLPGEGLLVWKVDEPKEQTGPEMPGLSLIQADGQNNLNNPSDVDQGDDGDPFPGSTGRTTLGDLGATSTSFGTKRSGISLRNISIDEGGVVTLDVRFTGARTRARAGQGADPPESRRAAGRGDRQNGKEGSRQEGHGEDGHNENVHRRGRHGPDWHGAERHGEAGDGQIRDSEDGSRDKEEGGQNHHGKEVHGKGRCDEENVGEERDSEAGHSKDSDDEKGDKGGRRVEEGDRGS
ncbi:M6 family metalloprotease domain-containing protein [Sabulicella rubraurantiaca]|uniref:M6 family metalloprotease domain-containing protein n=1 Tax=Sabulicella rubraurantiaca TaxID=2811429 RepID=UPI001A96E9E1|nr:M6 family metalloprotease domain-containing protein [Sabulicella rubraurantiaca]